MSIDNFTDKVISSFNKRITDEIFLTIQNNHELMHEYLRLVEEKGLDAVNMRIGKIVKEKYELNNSDREDSPKSTLIQSHQKFE